MNKHPAFFKFFVQKLSNTKLQIPPTFIQSIERALPEQVYLRCRCNNTWEIKVEKLENDWYFSDGWVKFVADNVVKGGDLLVFQYFCDNAFNVKLHGSDATEKNLVGKYFMHERMENNHKEVVEEKDGDDGEETELEDNDYIPEGEEEPINSDGAETSGNKRKRHRSSNAHWYGEEIFRAGLAQQPINPYFITTIRGRQKHNLYIPKDIVRYSNLDLTQELLLIDPRGGEFRARCRKWKDGRVIVTRGWGRLCKANLVNKEDKCICEFIQRQDVGLCLNVSFLRANGQ